MLQPQVLLPADSNSELHAMQVRILILIGERPANLRAWFLSSMSLITEGGNRLILFDLKSFERDVRREVKDVKVVKRKVQAKMMKLVNSVKQIQEYRKDFETNFPKPDFKNAVKFFDGFYRYGSIDNLFGNADVTA